MYELYDGSNAYSEALEAAGMSGLKVHVTQGLAIERLTKEVKNLKKMVKATLVRTSCGSCLNMLC